MVPWGGDDGTMGGGGDDGTMGGSDGTMGGGGGGESTVDLYMYQHD